jgi:signal transduction histidine kinase
VGTLRGRLLAATLAAVLGTVVVTLLVAGLLVRRSVERGAVRALERDAALAALRLGGSPGPVPPALARLLAARGERVVLLPLPPPPSLPLRPEDRTALAAGEPTSGRVRWQGRDLLFAAHPTDGRALVVVRPARLGWADWGPFVGAFAFAGAVGLLLSAAVSAALAQAIARPVGRAAEASRRVAAGERPGQLPVEGPEELALLATSFNEMSARLERAREAERTFLLSVSHELKTPLTAIRGYAEALAEEAVSPAEAAEVLVAEAERLERLVHDLLDLARLDQRAFTVRREPLDLSAVAREAVRRHEHRAHGFEVRLEVEASGLAPALADPDRVLQVVSNLVENALRCTPTGGAVTVRAGPGEIAVSDTGPGLDPQDLPRAFERFFLYRRHGRDRPVGTGLGLAIVKELVEAMGGTVAVSSAPGRGSTFTVSLPVPEEGAEGAPERGPQDLTPGPPGPRT